MNKQKVIGIAVLVVVAMLVVATGVVFAAGLTQAGTPYSVEDDGDDYAQYWGPMHGRRGGWSSEAPFPPMHEAMVQAVAGATSLTVEEINARIAEGELLFSIALDAGMEEADFIDLMTETREAFLAEALENGWISEEQYQWMLDRGSGSSYGSGYGGCHRFDGDDFTAGGRGSGRGRRGSW